LKTAGIALLMLLCPSAGSALEASGPAPVLVTLADGSTLPLRSWSLTYEVASWRRGSSPAFASFSRLEAKELWLGRKTYPVAGAVLELQYDEAAREREVDGATQKVKVPVIRALTLIGADGKKATPRIEAPARELVMPSGDKELLVQPRSLDLVGQTLTGTKRNFCLVSFSTLVECNDTLGQQVVKVEFPK
jgi:hypothetical protein